MSCGRSLALLRIVAFACCSLALACLAACGGSGSSGTGGGTSTSNPLPTLTSLNPDSITAPGASFTMAVVGTNFISSSTVLWNGSARTTTLVSSTELQAAITTADVATATSVPVTVSNPAPGGGASQPIMFTINAGGNSVPTLTSLNPNTAVHYGPQFALIVSGSNFTSDATVLWNNSPLNTQYVSDNELQATVVATDIQDLGTVEVTVSNPAPGGTSDPLPFTITSGGFTVMEVNQAANDLVWDSVHQLIYLSVPGTATSNGNSIVALNPATGAIVSTQFAGSNPNVLAISDDDSYLYVGLDGQSSVQRFVLPGLTTDINYSIGQYVALDLQVAPGAPHTTAVTLGSPEVSPEAEGGVTIYDDATPRPTIAPGFLSSGGQIYGSLQWGSDATTLYAANNEDTGFDFYTLTVSSSGVALGHDYPGAFDSFANNIHFDSGTKLIYGDDGQVVDPSTGLPAGNFDVTGLIAPDSTLNAAFFYLYPDRDDPGVALQSFDLTQFTPVTKLVLYPITEGVMRLIRWGQNGLAFNTDGGHVYVYQGPLVQTVTNAVKSKSHSRVAP